MQMRYNVLMLFAAFFLSLQVNGQTEDYKKDKTPKRQETYKEVVKEVPKKKLSADNFKIGLRVGLSVGDILNSIAVGGAEKAIHLGPTIGMVIKTALSNKVSLQPEILIHSKGSKVKSTNLGVTETYSLNLYYLDIPVIIKAYAGKKTVKGVFGTGPQVGIGLFTHEYATISGNGGSDALSEFGKFPEVFNRFEFAWNADLGISIGDDQGFKAEITLRPTFAITPLLSNSDPVVRNFAVVASAALFFGKK